jgi:ABC-type dipeptide/oligopeptide/nickel transport system permease component
MIRYVLKRVLMIIPVILFVAVTIFTIMYFCPGDPAKVILGGGSTQADVEILREKMGLNDPFFVQLGRFMYQTFIKFDLGNSYMSGKSVGAEIMARLPITLTFAFSAMVIQVLVAIPLGVTAATHQNSWRDRLCMLIAILGVSVPPFWLGLQLMLLFSRKLGWLPAYGIASWKGWILPIFVNGVHGIALMARQSRSSMLEVIRSDFVVTARAKGLPEKTILYKYALPNGLIPLIQVMGDSFGASLGGTVIIENVFSIPGIGQFMTNAIGTRDYAVIRGSVVVLAIAFSLVMLLVDVAFGFVDPRIKAQYQDANRRIEFKWGRRAKANA